MINTITDIDTIEYETKDPGELLDSIRKRGVAIAVIVNRTDGGFKCIDGNKRLSACALLMEENEKFRRIPIMIQNDFTKAGSGFWGNTQNHH